MITQNRLKVSKLFYDYIRNNQTIDSLVQELLEGELLLSEKYAYQAFCCAILSKNSTGYLEKGKFIKQYGSFISKSLEIEPNLIEARLIRYLIESNLENVQFTDHRGEDLEFLKDNGTGISDPYLKEIIHTVIQNRENA